MERNTSRVTAPWALALAIAFAPFLALGGPALNAAIQGQDVKNPHGDLKEPCALCHTANGWKEIRVSPKFDHSKYGFALTGAHKANCLQCHTTLKFEAQDVRCASCHQDPHRGEMGTECARCHGSRSFIDRAQMVRAHQLTRFPLTGAHSMLECETCHASQAQGHMQFKGTRAACDGCHLADYQATRNPDHQAGGFPLQCTQCHGTVGWSTARFDHDRTQFPLTGAHRTTACQSCHGDGVFAGKSTACVSCHQADYNGTTDPNHAASGFSTQCQSCHNTTSWASATFDHNQTGFPLTGAHVSLACQSCHGDGVFAGKPTACASCHQGNYDGTTDPNHAAAGFSTQCQSCHNTTAWSGATFSAHDANSFPIYSGTHLGRWGACSDCHTNNQSYGQFTCFSCHPHSDKTQTDSNHSGVSGYSYDSNACYSCHPRGQK